MTRDQVRHVLERTGRPVKVAPGVLDLPVPPPKLDSGQGEQVLPAFIHKRAHGSGTLPSIPDARAVLTEVFGESFRMLTSAQAPHWVILQHGAERDPRQHIRGHLLVMGGEMLVAYHFRRLTLADCFFTLVWSELDFGSVRAIQGFVPGWHSWEADDAPASILRLNE